MEKEKMITVPESLAVAAGAAAESAQIYLAALSAIVKAEVSGADAVRLQQLALEAISVAENARVLSREHFPD